MKKILTLIGIVAFMCVAFFVTMPREAKAADVYLLPVHLDSTTCWVQQGDRPYTVILFDTLTFDAADGDSTIDLGVTHYNFSFRSLNGAGDSGSVKVAFGSHQSHWHDDSISRNLHWSAIGVDTADDYLFAAIGSRYVYVRNVVGGTADSNCTVEMKAYR